LSKGYEIHILRQYEVLPIDNAIKDALEAFVAEPKESMPDAWH